MKTPYELESPAFARPYHDTKGGSDILEVTFFCEGEIVSDYEETRYLPYTYLMVSETSVEIDMVKPQVTNCLAIEEDIHTALRKIFGKDYSVCWVTL